METIGGIIFLSFVLLIVILNFSKPIRSLFHAFRPRPLDLNKYYKFYNCPHCQNTILDLANEIHDYTFDDESEQCICDKCGGKFRFRDS
jgi:hypothetical protein